MDGLYGKVPLKWMIWGYPPSGNLFDLLLAPTAGRSLACLATSDGDMGGFEEFHTGLQWHVKRISWISWNLRRHFDDLMRFNGHPWWLKQHTFWT